jgi:outer membrane receptor for monomeric catechols
VSENKVGRLIFTERSDVKKLAFICLMMIGSRASAGLEFRAHYGVLNGDASAFNTGVQSDITNNPTLNGKLPMYGADLLYVMPFVHLSFGVRYEMFDFKNSGPATFGGIPVTSDTELKGSRLSALVGYRLLENSLFYLGILGHYGLSQKMEYDDNLTVSGTTTSNTYTGTVAPSYGGGVEAGVTLGPIILGAEVGYTIFKATSFTSSGATVNDASGNPITLDLSGTYYKAMVGFTF